MVDEFMNRLEEISEACQLHLKPLDKKKQRLITYTHKLDWLEQLKEATEHSMIFYLCILILYVQVNNLALHIPGNAH